MREYWSENWDFWLLWFVVGVLIGIPVAATLGAMQNTVQQIISGY